MKAFLIWMFAIVFLACVMIDRVYKSADVRLIGSCAAIGLAIMGLQEFYPAVFHCLRALCIWALIIVFACIFPLAAGIVAGIVFLIWFVSRINVIARAAQERGELARAQRWNHYGY